MTDDQLEALIDRVAETADDETLHIISMILDKLLALRELNQLLRTSNAELAAEVERLGGKSYRVEVILQDKTPATDSLVVPGNNTVQ